jgi:hypothetical protein
MEFLRHESIAAGCSAIELTTADDNYRAQHLYQSVGYLRIGWLTIQLDGVPEGESAASTEGRFRRELHYAMPVRPLGFGKLTAALTQRTVVVSS